MKRPIVIYDSCVLYPAPLRDLLMRLAVRDLYQAKWTDEIHREWIYNLLKNRPDLTEEGLCRTKEKMNRHIRDCMVEGYEKLIKELTLPDPHDRHVLAAAIYTKAQLIITFNLRDFPAKALNQYNIKASHPDDFFISLLDLDRATVIATMRETKLSLKNPTKSPEEYLGILKSQSLPRTADYVRGYLKNI